MVDVFFEIQKGELVSVNRINIRGNTKTRDKVIRRELRIAEGDTFNQSLLDYSKKRVNALGYFEKVEMSTKRGAGRRQDGRQLRGRRAPDRHLPDRRRVLLGRELHRPGPDLAEQPASGAAQLLTLQAQLSSLRQLFLLQFQDLYFLDTNWTFGFNLFKQDQFLYSFIRSSKGGSLTWGYLLAEDLRLLLTYKLEQVGIGVELVRVRRRALRHADHRRPHRHQRDRQPVPLGDHLVDPRHALLRLAQRPHVPQPRLVQHALRRDRRSRRHLLAEHLHPLRGGDAASSIRSGARSSFAPSWRAI